MSPGRGSGPAGTGPEGKAFQADGPTREYHRPGASVVDLQWHRAARVADAASAFDRGWFAAHPGEREMVRHPFDGEHPFTEVPPGARQLVRVVMLAPGVRARVPFCVPDDEVSP